MSMKGIVQTEGKPNAKGRQKEIIQAQLRGEDVRVGEGDSYKRKGTSKCT